MKVSALRNRNHKPDIRHRALYEGRDRWHDLVKVWLPQHEVEPEGRYKARKEAATYANHAGAIVDFLRAHLFSGPIEIDGGDAWFTDWTDNVDQAGTDLSAFWSEVLLDALVHRSGWVWVCLPKGGDFGDLGSQVAAGALDAYLLRIEPESIVWVERQGKKASWLLFEEASERRGSPDEDPIVEYHWTMVSETQIRRWQWTSRDKAVRQPKDTDDAIELEPIFHGFGRLPLIELGLSDGLWAMGKLADPAIAHIRARCGLSWALYLTANPLLVLGTNTPATPITGEGYYLQTHQEDRVYYVEPTGASFQILAEDVIRLREEIYRVVQQLAQAADSNATRTAMSGASKGRDWQATEIVLSAYADAVLRAAREAVEVVAAIRKASTPPTLSGLEGWQTEDVETQLAALAMAIDAKSLSPTFRREAAKAQAALALGERASPEVMETIREEIDEAPAEDPAPYVPPKVPDAEQDPKADRSAERGPGGSDGRTGRKDPPRPG